MGICFSMASVEKSGGEEYMKEEKLLGYPPGQFTY